MNLYFQTFLMFYSYEKNLLITSYTFHASVIKKLTLLCLSRWIENVWIYDEEVSAVQ